MTRVYTKSEAFVAGYYKFPPPPICVVGWTPQNWIDYIDMCGVWTVPVR